LIRRAIRYGKILNIEINFITKISEKIFRIYQDYSDLENNKENIINKMDVRLLATLKMGGCVVDNQAFAVKLCVVMVLLRQARHVMITIR
jgi:alanyl-tRNA synthetase